MKNENTPDSSVTHNYLKFLLCGIAFLLFLLILVMAIPPCTSIFMYLTGEKSKLELIKLIGWGISGLIAIFGVVGIFKRAEALDKQNTNNKDAHDEQIEALNKQHKMIEKGHVHERFKTATEHLDNERVLVRIAAFNEFYHVAEIEPDLRQTILNILCTHLRLTTKDENYQKEEKSAGTPISIEIKPTEEVQSLLNILFKPDNKDNLIFADLVADLEEVYLPGAKLQNANLQNANLHKAKLQNAKLQNAKLQNAKLHKANLQNANLQNANLQNAKPLKANLQNANLIKANLHKANLYSANLQNANLQNANLQEAYLFSTDLRNTTMREANLQGANLIAANLRGANLIKANLHKANLHKANLHNANLQNANLHKTNLQEADLFSTDLQNTTMREANLQGANLITANLRGANLQRADLQEARLYDAHLQGANLINANLRGADLNNAKINKDTTRLPHDWEKVVEKGANDETEVIFVKD